MKSELKSFYPNFPSVILPLNGLPTVEFSVLVVSLKTTLTELPRPLEQFYRQLSTTLLLMFWELVENLKRDKLELKDSTFSKSAPAYFMNNSDKICHNYPQRRC